MGQGCGLPRPLSTQTGPGSSAELKEGGILVQWKARECQCQPGAQSRTSE